jgi:hypothetical protein
MTLSREDYAVAGTNRGANVIRLTGFLRDDDLIAHDRSFGRIESTATHENIQRTTGSRKRLFDAIAFRLLEWADQRWPQQGICRCSVGGTVKPPDRFTCGSGKNPERRHGSLKAIDPTTGETEAALKLTCPNYSGAGRLRQARPSTRHRAGAAEAAGARRSSAKTVNRLLTTFVGSA